VAKHPAAEHHSKAADKHRQAEEAHRKAFDAHEQEQHDDALAHANEAHEHGQEATRHGQQARDAYNPSGRASRTDLPPEASGLDQNPVQQGTRQTPGKERRGDE
jgi:hypothetical protein